MEPREYNLDQLLREGPYVVPDYQRRFCWKATEEIEEFLLDLREVWQEDDPRQSHFFGVMIFQPAEDSGPKQVIDGQQRLVAALMVISHCRRLLRELKHDADDLDQLLRAKALSWTESSEVLQLRGRDEIFFRRTVVEGGKYKAGRGGPTYLRTAWKRIGETIESWARSPETLKKLAEAILLRFRIIRVLVDSDEDSYLVFEVLNSRGLPLNPSDLLKNYLYRKAKKERTTDDARSYWDLITETILKTTSEDKASEIDKFLRRYWLSAVEFVRMKKLFQSIKSQLKSARMGAKEFLEELADEADRYFHILKPDKRHWKDDDVSAAMTGILDSLGAKQPIPLLMSLGALWSERLLDTAELKGVLRLLSVLTVRYTTLCRKPPNVLEREYHEWARGVRNTKSTAELTSVLKAFKGEIIPLIPSDEDVIDAVSQVELGSNEAKYILRGIEQHLIPAREHVLSGKLSLEHILPQSRRAWRDDPSWKKIPSERRDYFAGLLGNLTLLTQQDNRIAASSSFSKKQQEVYSKSNLSITKSLAEKYAEWTPDIIEKRTNWLARKVVATWPKPKLRN